MKAFVPAAGIGSRLKPWTDFHPKALVEVGGKPMLSRVVDLLYAHNITDITVNVHHFASQIYDFIRENDLKVKISDETSRLLETGGALLKAKEYLISDSEPILIHNVDILSNADIDSLLKFHTSNHNLASLLVSRRDSSRKLIFDANGSLCGWHNLNTKEIRPANLEVTDTMRELAFSGIYIISPTLIYEMEKNGWEGKFSIIDYLLATMQNGRYKCFFQEDLNLLDIGKPDSLSRAQSLF